MTEKEEMTIALRNLSLDRAAVRLMREDLPRLEEDIKKELPAQQREALEIKRARLLSSMEVTEHQISRLERLLSLLSPEEQLVLERMLINPYPGVIFDLASEFGCETSRVYRIRARALSKLVRLRYGAGADA